MSIEQLRQLIRRYVSGHLNRDEFRRAFVAEFLSVRHDDKLADRLSNSIESLCSDYAQGHIADELSFKAAVAHAALSPSTQSVQAATRCDFVFDPARRNIVPSAWWDVTSENPVVLSPSIVAVESSNDDNRKRKTVAA